MDFALGGPHLYTFLMTGPRERTRRFPDDFASDASPAFMHLVVLVEEGMRTGRLRGDDPLEVTLALTAAVQGLVQLYLGGRIGPAEDEFRAAPKDGEEGPRWRPGLGARRPAWWCWWSRGRAAARGAAASRPSASSATGASVRAAQGMGVRRFVL
ncbi:hypothetical protein GCM10010149_14840 [Nonomuraea roseoviolacea subsp. roseoviolacea]|uniref:TetR-like C-terminal domain-containing protein n=1 Tax=Nonomuraea roseoviolacea TaxID=103837 RepID=UPI0031D7AAFA